MTQTPVAGLRDHAAQTPEDPWLFRREGWNWRWISFRAAAADAVLAALSSGGGAPLPLGAEGRGTRGGGDGGGGGQGLSFEAVLQDLACQAAGQPIVLSGPDGSVELSADDLAAAAAAVAGLLRAATSGQRDILVLGGALDDPATRVLLSWATVAGAALLLEAGSGNVLGTAVWARPTVFAGTVEEISRLRLAAERQERGWLRRRFRRRVGLPFGRLHTVLVTDCGSLPPEEESFWRERGVAVRFLPQCGIAWYISRRGDPDA